MPPSMQYSKELAEIQLSEKSSEDGFAPPLTKSATVAYRETSEDPTPNDVVEDKTSTLWRSTSSDAYQYESPSQAPSIAFADVKRTNLCDASNPLTVIEHSRSATIARKPREKRPSDIDFMDMAEGWEDAAAEVPPFFVTNVLFVAVSIWRAVISYRSLSVTHTEACYFHFYTQTKKYFTDTLSAACQADISVSSFRNKSTRGNPLFKKLSGPSELSSSTLSEDLDSPKELPKDGGCVLS